MRNLLCEPLPDAVTAAGQEYPVCTDFRDWIRFAGLLGSKELTNTEKLQTAWLWFLEPPSVFSEELLRALIGFYRGAAPQPEKSDPEEPTIPRPPTFDWTVDAGYVIGDFRRFYGMDLLRIEYLHWWEFRALFEALPDDSCVMKRIAYRGADLSQIKNESERRRVARIQRMLALPFAYDDEMIGAVLWEES